MPIPGDDPLVDAIALEIGHALADWSSIETHLSMLFDQLSGVDNLTRSQVITASVVSFDARMDMCDNLMRFETEEDAIHAAVWTKLSAKIRKFYKRRHEIAHFIIATSQPNGVRQAHCMPFWSIGNTVLERGKSLTVDDIRRRAKIFRDICQAVAWFWIRVARRKGRQLPAPERVPDLILELRTLVAQSPIET